MGYRIPPFIRWFSPVKRWNFWLWLNRFDVYILYSLLVHWNDIGEDVKNCVWSPISDQQPLVVGLVHRGLYSQCSPSLEDCLTVNLSPAMYKKDCQNVGFWIPHRIHWTGILKIDTPVPFYPMGTTGRLLYAYRSLFGIWNQILLSKLERLRHVKQKSTLICLRLFQHTFGTHP